MKPLRFLYQLADRTGSALVGIFADAAFLTGIVIRVLYDTARPRTWSRPVVDEVLRQIYYSGVKAVSLTLLIALLLGPALISQMLVWSALIGETALLVQLMGLLILRDFGPVLINLIIIGRSGMAITAEIGTLNAGGLTRVLDASGVDPFRYLVLTRVVGCGIAALVLTQIFGLTLLLTGYGFAMVLGVANISLSDYLAGMLAQTTIGDFVLILMKTVLPAMLTAAICCWRGMLVTRSMTEIARELPTAFVLCTVALFVCAAIFTLAI